MNLPAYLERVGYAGPLQPNLTTLIALHRAHLLRIPYENLDIHLGRELALDEAAFFAKLVGQRRGGWCYEMNGLFAAALRALGFEVMLLSGAVNRAANGDDADGNHLVLLVRLDRPYLADVGFGNGFLEPLPLEAGVYRQGQRSFTLSRVGERWQLEPDPSCGPGYDFTLAPHRLGDFAAQCRRQQSSPNSGFVRVAVCHRLTLDGVDSLRGAVLATTRASGVEERVIGDGEEYQAVLATHFGLQLPETRRLWALVWERHQQWVQEQDTPSA
jgi:N-hydroxyarylamine O-acetyltransferase